MTLLISACLLGVPCRYDGKSVPCAAALEAAGRGVRLVPFCPEIYGGLPTPRVPAERRGDRVVTRDGRDVTAEYRRGAEEALRVCRLFGCEAAILKERSPSCGCGRVYDGTFSGVLTEGDGVTAALLKANGVHVAGETEAGALLKDK
ncbi:MAG: DUF523 domain-containing protein [Clostridia bacterium]|nr:DUF523 domain-containing protein [Clostridia bacterium]